MRSFFLFRKRRKVATPISTPEIPLESTNKQRSWYAIKSETQKAVNQDAYQDFHDDKSGTVVLALADGIGSSKHAEEGSRFVVDKAIELLKEEVQNGRNIDYLGIFNRIQLELTAMIEQKHEGQPDVINAYDFGTTLIVGVDAPDIFTLAYIGNGCAYYLQGDVTCFPNSNHFPWAINDLLTPHSLPNKTNGKDELCKYFCYHPTNVDQTVPTVVSISKNHHAGEIFVLATDGFDSCDKHDVFFYQNKVLFTNSCWNMSLLCKDIKAYLKTTQKIDDEGLTEVLTDYLDSQQNDDRMNDDTTIGIIVSTRVAPKLP